MKTKKKSGAGNVILIVVVSLVGLVFLSMLIRPRTQQAPQAQPRPGETTTWGIFSGIASIISALNPAAIIESFRKKPTGGGGEPMAVDCSLFPDDPECLG